MKVHSLEQSGGEALALDSLESILRTRELRERPSRPPDYEAENHALARLVLSLAESPRGILQSLADEILGTLRAGSAGISLLTEDGERFYWAAIAGAWHPQVGGGTPRDFGPCGDVLDHDAPLLFTHWERRYPYLLEAKPLAEEGLLVPFYVDGRAVGTIWAISHDEDRKFDREDLRQLESLGRFASAAHQAVRADVALARSHQMVDVQERERLRLARELHDEIGQVLTAISLSLGAAKRARRDPHPGLEQALRLTNELMEQVRNLCSTLRPPMLCDFGLLATLEWHFEIYKERFKIAVNFKQAGLEGRRFSPELEIAAYRIVQEALTNVARHAAVPSADVEMTADERALVVTIRDRGAGFDPKATSARTTAGIGGMQERAAMVGGWLKVESAPGEGTRVMAKLPLAGSARAGKA